MASLVFYRRPNLMYIGPINSTSVSLDCGAGFEIWLGSGKGIAVQKEKERKGEVHRIVWFNL